jgi:hypothetical protein
MDSDLAVGGSISLDGTVDGVDVSDHAALHERGGSQVVRAARLHSDTDAGKPPSGNTEGDVWWAADTDKLYLWSGAAWKEIGAAGGGSVAIEEADVQVVAAASVLDFGAGFDVTEDPSGEANIALDLAQAVWTFAQGGFRFRDGSGPLLYAEASGDNLLLTGDFDVSGHGAIGSLASIQATEALRIYETFAAVGAQQPKGLYVNVEETGSGLSQFFAAYCLAVHKGSSGRAAVGLGGEGKTQATGAGSAAVGLDFYATAEAGANSVTSLMALKVTPRSAVTQSGAITGARGLEIDGQWNGSKPATVYGVYLSSSLGASGVGTAYGIYVQDLTAGTVRLLELGPTTPYLRLVGGAAPGANQTNLHLYEGSTPALRQVQWKAGNALGAGDKVLVLV